MIATSDRVLFSTPTEAQQKALFKSTSFKNSKGTLSFNSPIKIKH